MLNVSKTERRFNVPNNVANNQLICCYDMKRCTQTSPDLIQI